MEVKMLNNKVKFCVVCGRIIPELSLRRVVCSERCRNRKKSGYAPYINYDRPPRINYGDLPLDELTVIQKEAHSNGMSYGQYVATKYKEEKKGGNR